MKAFFHSPSYSLSPTYSIPPINPSQNPGAPSTNHSDHTIKRPSYLHDYHCYTFSSSTSSSCTSHPLSEVLCYQKHSPSHKHFVCNLSSNIKPISFSQTIDFPKWQEAISHELKALEIMVLGALLLSHQGRIQWDVNGSIGSSTMHMVPLSTIKCFVLQKAIHNKELIILTLFPCC